MINTYRHTYGQALAASRLGENVARDAGDAHEGDAANVLERPEFAGRLQALQENGTSFTLNDNEAGVTDNIVDQLNNEVGRRIAAEVTQEMQDLDMGSQEMIEAAIQIRVLEAQENGELYEREGNTIRRSSVPENRPQTTPTQTGG